jgi:hypothetical protein
VSDKIRANFYVNEVAYAKLQRLAYIRGVSSSEIIRLLIGAYTDANWKPEFDQPDEEQLDLLEDPNVGT